MPEPVIICLHQPALELAEKVASLCDGEVHGLQSRVKTITKTFKKTKEHLRDLFQKGHPLDGICSSGKSIAVLCEGDPMFYGSFSYLFGRLSQTFPTEVLPAVSSPMACAAASGWVLAAKNEPFTVLPGPMEISSLRRKLESAGSFALMKIGRHFQKICSLLEELNLAEEACLVEHATLPNQRILKLHQVDPERVPYFSMILVRRHA